MLRAVHWLRLVRCRSVHTVKCSNSLVDVKHSLLGAIEGEDNGKPLQWYSCGPTVYDTSHLGHARTYVCTDIIRRILSNYFHIPVHFALGITDVDDKIINRAREAGHSDWEGMKEYAKQFEESFFQDMAALGVERPHAILRVTDHMKEIEEFVGTLQAGDYAYEGPDGVWFDVRKVEKTYGALGNVPPVSDDGNLDEQNEPQDAEERGVGKRYPRDFSLWKAAKVGEPFYDSDKLGAGRPGWHIECSAVVNSYFGAHIDIHSGGCDLKFPHHTNEIAQSEAYLDATGNRSAVGKPWCGTWLHTGHLYIDGLKMSKSLKNFISIREYLDGGYSTFPAEDFRLFCLQHRYHSSLHFSKDRIVQAAALREKVRGFLHRCEEALTTDTDIDINRQKQGGCKEEADNRALLLTKAHLSAQYGVAQAFADDFDTPAALQHITALISEASTYLNYMESSGNKNQVSSDPLRAAASQVNTFFANVGLHLAPTSMKKNSASDTTQTDVDRDETVMRALVAFRSKIRASALTSLKKGSEVTPKDTLVAILKECDMQRDEVIPSLGFKLDDKPSGDSSFRRV